MTPLLMACSLLLMLATALARSLPYGKAPMLLLVLHLPPISMLMSGATSRGLYGTMAFRSRPLTPHPKFLLKLRPIEALAILTSQA